MRNDTGLFEDDPAYMNTPAYTNYCKLRQEIASAPISKPVSRLTLPFRAVRFACHLIKIKQYHIIFKTVWSFIGSWSHFLLYISRCREFSGYVAKIESSGSIKISPDSITPWGAVKNNISNMAFIVAAIKKYGRDGAFLDLGCSSGKLVFDFALVGWTSVGLDVCDEMHKRGLGYWSAYHNLRVCDISQPFKIDNVFDVITAWDVVEHLDKEGLDNLMNSVRFLMHNKSVFIITTANNSDCPLGIELHQTQWPREKWIEYFVSKGFIVKPATKVFKRHQMVRHSADNCEFALSLN